ncbi:hypothetical protein O3M35_004893 [Rhynocoris fuscipes]|uniref:Uncharacterized protein n=1 Tax=Rhynocoris fuscipes TaxID=488301 RepID=A0AAW1DLJ0_9HEMI
MDRDSTDIECLDTDADYNILHINSSDCDVDNFKMVKNKVKRSINSPKKSVASKQKRTDNIANTRQRSASASSWISVNSDKNSQLSSSQNSNIQTNTTFDKNKQANTSTSQIFSPSNSPKDASNFFTKNPFTPLAVPDEEVMNTTITPPKHKPPPIYINNVAQSAYTPKANQQLMLLSPERLGVSKCKLTCHSAGIEPVIALVNARVIVHDQKTTTVTTQRV